MNSLLRIFLIGISIGILGMGIPKDLLASESGENHSHFVAVDRDGKYLGIVVEIEEGEARVGILKGINGQTVLFSIVGQRIAGSDESYLAYTTPSCSGTPYLPLPTKVSSVVEQSIVEGQMLFFTAMDEASTIKEQGPKPLSAGTCFNLAQTPNFWFPLWCTPRSVSRNLNSCGSLFGSI